MIREHAVVSQLDIAGADVHVWQMCFTDLIGVGMRAVNADWLSPDEVARAQRYLSPQAHQQFVAGRAVLRGILAHYLDVSPDKVRFCYSAQGKPVLDDHCSDNALQFNVSHSDNMLVMAVTWGRALGIDVERIRSIPEMDVIAKRFFSSTEVAQLQSVPYDRKPQAFFTCWTRKEAYIKARGGGLAIPLDGFDVSFLPGERARLRVAQDDTQSWTMRSLAMPMDYAGALVVEIL